MSSSSKIIKAMDVKLTAYAADEGLDQFRPSSWPGDGAGGSGSPSHSLDREMEERLLRDAFERGRRAGIDETENRGNREEASALRALDAIHRECLEIKNRLFDGLEHTVIVLAFALAEKIIRREVTLDRKIIAENLEETIRGIKDASELFISLNPEDEQYIRERGFDDLDRDVTIRLTADQSLQPGDVLVETSGLVIDARIIDQLDVLKAALTGREGEGEP